MKKIFLLLSMLSFSEVYAQSIQSPDGITEKFTCYFDYNSAVWHKDSIAKFKIWYEKYANQNGLTISLKAFTDTIGSISRNQNLAQRRLSTVQSYFSQQKLGINKTAALGESYDKSDYKNNASYRKVEIILNYQPVEKSETPELEERLEAFANSTDAVNLNIQFVGGQDIYIGDSYLDVVALIEYLERNPTKKAFIRGHVCCENDYELSHRRALAVYNDLLKAGISADRIRYQGFGNTMPIAEEVDAFSKQQNRRVDVVFSE